MGLTLQFSIEGERQLSRELAVSAGSIKNFRKPLTQAAEALEKSFDANFASRGALFGGWAPRTREYPWPLLEKTGRLRKSFHHEVTGDTATLGNRAPYFKYHQSNQPRKRLPRRVMMAIDHTRRALIIRAFQTHIHESTAGLK